MPKMLSSKKVVAVLLREGFIFVSQRGSHGKYRRGLTGKTATVIVPINKREMPIGTLRSIVRQSQLSEEKFFGT